METIEIERKYLLNPDLFNTYQWIWGGGDKIERIHQGYLSTKPWDVRIRLSKVAIGPGAQGPMCATLTMKHGSGLTRTEISTQLSAEKGEVIFENCPLRISKTRYHLGRLEIDVYNAPHRGLAVAEIELTSEDEVVEFPDWIKPYVIAEVTHDERFKNASLAQSSEDIWATYGH
jgi:adenylate cyclase